MSSFGPNAEWSRWFSETPSIESGLVWIPSNNSPAINRGAFIQKMGFQALDLGGNPRIVGSRIDMDT